MDKENKKKLVNICAVFGDDQIRKIIYGCNLKPTESWKVWEDSVGNQLCYNKKFKIKIKEKNLKSDIYIKCNPKNIIKSSTWVMIVKFNKNCLYFLFYGVDKIFRCSYFKDGEWIENVSPLEIGLEGLSIAVNSFRIRSFSEIDVPISLTNKSKVDNVLVSKIPVSEDLINKLKQNGIEERVIKEIFNGY